MTNPFGNIADIYKMKNMLDDIQKDISKLTATGCAGIDMVTVKLDGNNNCLDVHISQEAMDLGREAMQTLVAAAVTDANRALTEKKTEYQQEMGRKLMPNFNAGN